MRKLIVVCVAMLLCAAHVQAEPHVVIITIDGFAAYNMKDKNAPIPTLRKLAEEGAVAEGMKVCNPSVTWPNHTTLISGVRPDKHGVLFNGILERPGAGLPVGIEPKHDGSDLVGVQTLPDILHKAGMRCGEIDWPCTRNSPAYEDNFSDVPEQVKWMTPKLREELVAMKELPDATDKTWGPLSAARKDQIWTAAACQVIRARKPNLLLLHLLVTDGLQHKYGPQTPGAFAAIGLADAHIRDVLRALDEAGIRQETTIFIVADHGFAAASKLICPNVLFRKEGLLKSALLKIASARVEAVSEGGTAFVYFTDPQTMSQDKAKVRALLKDAEGIEEIIEPDRYGDFHYPLPEKNRQMAEMVLAAKPDYAFSNKATGEDL
jgi:predicted AlkP superfamily pyrophosphatase or phosphodiesterase